MFKVIFVAVIVVLTISGYLAQESDKKTGKVTSTKEIGRSSGSIIVDIFIGLGEGIGEGFRKGYKNNSDSIMNASNKRLTKANREVVKEYEKIMRGHKKKKKNNLKIM